MVKAHYNNQQEIILLSYYIIHTQTIHMTIEWTSLCSAMERLHIYNNNWTTTKCIEMQIRASADSICSSGLDCLLDTLVKSIFQHSLRFPFNIPFVDWYCAIPFIFIWNFCQWHCGWLPNVVWFVEHSRRFDDDFSFIQRNAYLKDSHFEFSLWWHKRMRWAFCIYRVDRMENSKKNNVSNCFVLWISLQAICKLFYFFVLRVAFCPLHCTT